jgi:hypothetical protein
MVFPDVNMLPSNAKRMPELTDDKLEQGALRMAVIDGRIQGYKIARTLRDVARGAIYADSGHAYEYLKGYRRAKLGTDAEIEEITAPADSAESGKDLAAVLSELREQTRILKKILRELMPAQKNVGEQMRTKTDEFKPEESEAAS